MLDIIWKHFLRTNNMDYFRIWPLYYGEHYRFKFIHPRYFRLNFFFIFTIKTINIYLESAHWVLQIDTKIGFFSTLIGFINNFSKFSHSFPCILPSLYFRILSHNFIFLKTTQYDKFTVIQIFYISLFVLKR